LYLPPSIILKAGDYAVQALIVQLGCMAYEFYLLQRCNVSHMRLFSVFLALPSATVRLMAARQLQVDDDSREEVEEDDMELAEAAVGGAVAGDTAEGIEAGAEGERKQKSVRMVVEGEQQADVTEQQANLQLATGAITYKACRPAQLLQYCARHYCGGQQL
jgi:hypothetical protein